MKERPPWLENPEEWYEFEGSWHRHTPGSDPFTKLVVYGALAVVGGFVWWIVGKFLELILQPIVDWLVWG